MEEVTTSPFFSIIIPVYNVAPYLRECLDSVLAQTFTDWEMICVDDGSTDDSGEILDTYAKQDHRIIAVHIRNRGVSAARYAGFVKSKGNWIWLVDGDDRLLPHSLATVCSALNLYRPDILQTSYIKHNGVRVIGKYSPVAGQGVYNIGDFFVQVEVSPVGVTGMCIGDKIYARCTAEKAFACVADCQIAHYEDGLFATAATLNAERYASINDVCYCYIIHKDSSSNRFNPNIVQEQELFVSKALDLIRASRYARLPFANRANINQSRDAICRVYNDLLRWDANLSCIRVALSQLQTSEFYSIGYNAVGIIERLVISNIFAFWSRRVLLRACNFIRRLVAKKEF